MEGQQIMFKAKQGYTLIETALVLALISLLLSVGTPALLQMLHGQQLRAASIDLAMALTLARQEAIMRKHPVLVANKNSNWAEGWQVFVDLNSNGTFDAGEPVIREGDAIAHGLRISGNALVKSYVRYMPNGLAKMQNGAFQAGTITLCHTDGEQAIRRLVLSATGRLRTFKDAAGSC